MIPVGARPARDRVSWKQNKRKTNWCPSAPPYSVKVPAVPCPSGTWPKISHCISSTYNLGTFQTAASALGLGTSKILNTLLKYRFSVSYSSPVLAGISPADLQSQMLCGLISLVQSLGLGSLAWGSEPSFFRRTCEPLSLSGQRVAALGMWVLAKSHLHPSYLSQYSFIFFIFVIVQSLSHVQLFVTPRTAAH